jgi:methyl acetate hydrolase
MRTDRRGLLQAGAALVASAAVARRGFGQEGNRPVLEKNLDTVLRDAVERGDVPGVIGAVTNRDETIYQGAFGERRLGQGVPMTIDTVTYLASMTKPITATAAMQLVEQGKLELDAPISRWVP